MRAWITHHVTCSVTTLRRLLRAPLSSLANVLVIGLAATLPLVGLVAIDNGRALSGRATVEPTIGVFFALDAGKQEISAVEAVLRDTTGVRSIAFISRQDALERLKQTDGLSDALSTLRTNPLPDALVAGLDADLIAEEAQLVSRIRSMPKVAHVQLDTTWVERLRRVLNLASAGLAVLSTLLGAVFVGVTFNTVRAQVHQQADELAIARLVGATSGYLRRPFCHYGSWLGALGGLVALGLAWGAFAYLERPIEALAQAYGSGFRLLYPTLSHVSLVVGASGFLGLVGGFLAVSIYLLKNPNSA